MAMRNAAKRRAGTAVLSSGGRMHGGQTLDVAAGNGVGMRLVSGYAKGDAIPLSRE
jgi:hypothetical protein